MTRPSVEHDQLRAFVERLERMGEERRAIADDIKEIYAEAKGNGFDTKALKIVIRRREMDPAEREEQEALVDLYMGALGMPVATRAPARDEHSSAGHADQGGEESGMLDSLSADNSTAARKDAPGEPVTAGRETVALPEPANEIAGTQAPPVEAFTAADNARQLRPYCLHTDDLTKCAGQGRKHCYECQKAHADDVGEAA